MSGLPDDHPCAKCGACCGYVTVQIAEPKELIDYDAICWYLLHENVRVCVDSEGEWLVEFRTRCKKLLPNLKCGEYETRPAICEEFDASDCHGRETHDGEQLSFDTVDEFRSYLKAQGVAYEPRALAKTLKK